MDESQITEDIMDALKVATFTSPAVAQTFFGFGLQDWMYIASIVASVFFIIEKLPSIVKRTYGWIKRESSGSSSGDGPADDHTAL